MTIDISKTYRTRDGREVRLFADDIQGGWPILGAVKGNAGWIPQTWAGDGTQISMGKSLDLVPADPHGILPHHRELLAEVVGGFFIEAREVKSIRNDPVNQMAQCFQAALIALAKLDAEKGVR